MPKRWSKTLSSRFKEKPRVSVFGKIIFASLLGLAFLYTVFLLILNTQQRRLFYYPPSSYILPQGVGIEAQEINLTQEGEARLTAWWMPPRALNADVNKTVPTVMVFHGNASAVYSNYDIFSDLMGQGYGVLSVAYPGYPGSDGTPSEAAMIEAARRQYAFLIESGIEPQNIVFYGTSLGAGIAAQLSLSHAPALLIMDAPFFSLVDMAKLHVNLPFVSVLVKDKFRSDLALKEAKFPVVILHGDQDDVIPAAESERLYQSLKGPKARYLIVGGGHTNLWGMSGRDITFAAIEALSKPERD